MSDSESKAGKVEPRELFEERKKGRHLLRRGQFPAALAHIERLEEIAQTVGSDECWLKATVARFRLMSEIDAWAVEPSKVRNLAFEAKSTEVRFLATFALVSIYRGREDWRKMQYYANCSLAQAGDRYLHQSDALNAIAVSYVAENRFAEARAVLERSWNLLGTGSHRTRRSIILDNMGFTSLYLGRPEEAVGILGDALRLAREVQTPGLELQPQLGSCLTYLEQSNATGALHHGHLAHALAERQSCLPAQKSALFLLGEAHKLAGEETAAYGRFSELQMRFVPNVSNLPDILLRTDTRGFLSLL